MSALTQFRDHCRKMADKTGALDEHALWTQLADEIDAYLDRPTEAVDLFGEVTTEPVPIADMAGIYADTGLTLDAFPENR